MLQFLLEARVISFIPFLLLPFSLVCGSQFVEQFGIHFHESFEDIIDKGDDRLVPVLLADTVEGWKHDGHNGRTVIFYQTHHVFIVP